MLYLIMLLFVSVGFAEEVPTVSLSISKTVRQENKVVISSENFKNSINETFASSGIDIQRNTIHPNISVKGATFQQSSVFIDGVKVDDPQTAHNNLNIPVASEDIERIELLSDRGYAGAVNIITKQPENKISENFSFGDFNTKNGNVSVSHRWEKFANRLSFEKKVSDGFTFDTDYDITNFSNRFEWNFSELKTGFSFGYLKKDFGARGFYADFPSYEWTKTYLSKIDLNFEQSGFLIKPEFQWKQSNDEFKLDVRKPGGPDNKHKTDVFTTQVNISKNNFSFVPIITTEKIESSNLGNHQRDVQDIYAGYNYDFTQNFNSTYGIRYNGFSNDSFILPYFSSSYNFAENAKLHFLFRKSARQLSFTELYYNDIANLGSSNLKYEKATLYETGMEYSFLSLNLFLRDEKDIIDWIKRNKTDTQWRATNIGSVRFYGYEFGGKKTFYKFKTTIKYSYTESPEVADFISKYALRYAQHLLTGEISYPIIWNIEHSINGLYKKRVSGEEYFVLDTELARKFSFGECYIGVDNLLDKNYIEIPFVPMPPRIVRVGIKLTF
ncbi:MAG: TonB-dependent receptor [Elusimicrobiota bacterium]